MASDSVNSTKAMAKILETFGGSAGAVVQPTAPEDGGAKTTRRPGRDPRQKRSPAKEPGLSLKAGEAGVPGMDGHGPGRPGPTLTATPATATQGMAGVTGGADPTCQPKRSRTTGRTCSKDPGGKAPGRTNPSRTQTREKSAKSQNGSRPQHLQHRQRLQHPLEVAAKRLSPLRLPRRPTRQRYVRGQRYVLHCFPCYLCAELETPSM